MRSLRRCYDCIGNSDLDALECYKDFKFLSFHPVRLVSHPASSYRYSDFVNIGNPVIKLTASSCRFQVY